MKSSNADDDRLVSKLLEKKIVIKKSNLSVLK